MMIMNARCLKRRLLATILVVALLLGCIPTAFAWNSEQAPPFTLTDSEDTPIDGNFLGLFDGYLYVYELSGNANLIIKIGGENILDIIDQDYVYSFSDGTDQNGNELPESFAYDESTNTYTLPLSIFQAATGSLQWLNTTYNIPLDPTGTYYLPIIDDNNGLQYYLLFLQKGSTTIDKEALGNAIENALPDSSKYYITNDRWNGKITSKSAQGFWQDLNDIVNKANEVYTNESATQDQVDAALAALNAALPEAKANLIPLENVNATALYEALHADWRWYYNELRLKEGTPVSKKNCTALTWYPYAQAKIDGQALLSELYDEEGNPTESNTSGRNDEVKTAAETIDAYKLVNIDAYNTAYENYLSSKAEAEALIEQYDPAKLSESDYSAESWAAYVSAYNVLKADMEYRIVGGTTEDYAMLKAFKGSLAAFGCS